MAAIRSTVAGGMSLATLLGLPLIPAVGTLFVAGFLGFVTLMSGQKLSCVLIAIVAVLTIKKIATICKDDEQAIYRRITCALLARKLARCGPIYKLEA